MKNILFVLLFFTFTNVASEGNFITKELAPRITEVEAANPAAGRVFYGVIGGKDDCTLKMPNGSLKGYYKYLGMTRSLRFGSYDRSTKVLTLKAYQQSNGKYIGQFVGKLSNNKDWTGLYSYKGEFTNYNGYSVKFDLDEPMWD